MPTTRSNRKNKLKTKVVYKTDELNSFYTLEIEDNAVVKTFSKTTRITFENEEAAEKEYSEVIASLAKEGYVVEETDDSKTQSLKKRRKCTDHDNKSKTKKKDAISHIMFTAKSKPSVKKYFPIKTNK
jgi:predicted DNA-binding WGR domain protein